MSEKLFYPDFRKLTRLLARPQYYQDLKDGDKIVMLDNIRGLQGRIFTFIKEEDKNRIITAVIKEPQGSGYFFSRFGKLPTKKIIG